MIRSDQMDSTNIRSVVFINGVKIFSSLNPDAKEFYPTYVRQRPTPRRVPDWQPQYAYGAPPVTQPYNNYRPPYEIPQQGRCTECFYRQSDMRVMEMRRAESRQAEIQHAEMRRAQMRHAEMLQADMRYAEMRHAELLNCKRPQEVLANQVLEQIRHAERGDSVNINILQVLENRKSEQALGMPIRGVASEQTLLVGRRASSGYLKRTNWPEKNMSVGTEAQHANADAQDVPVSVIYAKGLHRKYSEGLIGNEARSAPYPQAMSPNCEFKDNVLKSESLDTLVPQREASKEALATDVRNTCSRTSVEVINLPATGGTHLTLELEEEFKKDMQIVMKINQIMEEEESQEKRMEEKQKTSDRRALLPKLCNETKDLLSEDEELLNIQKVIAHIIQSSSEDEDELEAVVESINMRLADYPPPRKEKVQKVEIETGIEVQLNKVSKSQTNIKPHLNAEVLAGKAPPTTPIEELTRTKRNTDDVALKLINERKKKAVEKKTSNKKNLNITAKASKKPIIGNVTATATASTSAGGGHERWLGSTRVQRSTSNGSASVMRTKHISESMPNMSATERARHDLKVPESSSKTSAFRSSPIVTKSPTTSRGTGSTTHSTGVTKKTSTIAAKATTKSTVPTEREYHRPSEPLSQSVKTKSPTNLRVAPKSGTPTTGRTNPNDSKKKTARGAHTSR